ncbi:hypothetical protein DXG01_011600, partial [Tephrocybe rancida]
QYWNHAEQRGRPQSNEQCQNHRPLPRQRRGTSTHAPPLTAHLTERPHRHVTAKPMRRRCVCTNWTHKRHMLTPHHACTQPWTLKRRTPRARTTPDPRTTHALNPEPNLPTASRPLPTAHFWRVHDSTAHTPASGPPPRRWWCTHPPAAPKPVSTAKPKSQQGKKKTSVSRLEEDKAAEAAGTPSKLSKCD